MKSLRKIMWAALLVACLSCSFASVPPIPAGDFAGYLSYEQTVQYVNSLHKAVPQLAGAPRTMGKSVEGRDVIAFCIGVCSGKRSKTFMTGLTHSREVSVADFDWKAPRSNVALFAFCSPSACTSVCRLHMTYLLQLMLAMLEPWQCFSAVSCG